MRVIRPGQEIGGYETQGYVDRVQVVGHRAYIADGNWLLILDVSDPSFPVRLGLCHIAGGIEGLKVVGEKAYICERGVGLSVYDVSDPKLSSLGHLSHRSMDAQALAVAGPYAYLGRNGGWLATVDVSDADQHDVGQQRISGDAAGGRGGDGGLRVRRRAALAA